MTSPSWLLFAFRSLFSCRSFHPYYTSIFQIPTFVSMRPSFLYIQLSFNLFVLSNFIVNSSLLFPLAFLLDLLVTPPTVLFHHPRYELNFFPCSVYDSMFLFKRARREKQKRCTDMSIGVKLVPSNLVVKSLSLFVLFLMVSGINSSS